MTRLPVRASQAVGLALGALLFEAIRRQLRADTWDYGRTEAASGDRAERTVVAVPFSRDELRAVSRSADAAGTAPSQFIHDAALARASTPSGTTADGSSTGS